MPRNDRQHGDSGFTGLTTLVDMIVEAEVKIKSSNVQNMRNMREFGTERERIQSRMLKGS